MYEKIKNDAKNAICDFLELAQLKAGEILVIGCSSSEVMGGQIGKLSSTEAADAIFEAVCPILKEKGIYLAAQCCEHLNRALIVERECAEKYNLEEVCVLPAPKAGGSFATAAYRGLENACAVESIKAHAGIDIGNTLIGMHLRAVAVPVRIGQKTIGEANVVCAKTRPKLIGGARAVYPGEIR